MIRELAQATQSSTPGWTPEALAASVRIAVLVFVVPSLIFIALGILVERRMGARALVLFWAVAMAVALAYGSIAFHHISGRRAEMLRSMGGVRPLYFIAALIYGLPFALSSLAIWWAGARKRRRTRLQVTGGLLAWLFGVPLAILVGVATESLWGR